MKRLICLILVSFLFLCGCSISGERIKEPVTFYYVREGYQKNMDAVIVSEVREASGHREDLAYLLALYSMGPSKEDLKSPLPRNTKIELAERTDESIELHLSDSALTITDANFTLASACISMTCMELTGVQQVTVVSGDRTITIQEDTLLLYGSNMQKTQEDAK